MSNEKTIYIKLQNRLYLKKYLEKQLREIRLEIAALEENLAWVKEKSLDE